MILDEIVAHKRSAYAKLLSEDPIGKLIRELEERIETLLSPRDFIKGFSEDGVNIIAEIKKASPSAGIIREAFDPVELACEYEQNGARAISVLTDERYFQGELGYIEAIKSEVALPLLRKDFLLEEFDIYESRAAGADCVLLIARILEGENLKSMLESAHALGMEALIEVHNEEELERVLSLGANLIGINNRDLDTLEVDIATTLRLMERVANEGISWDRVIISESGISSFREIEPLREAGVSGFLVGEAILREENVGGKLRELRGFGA
ncbi:MAG: indole-3-glycerol phosphate synthase TrpC, partial [Deltaproteobacteria bacterium]|nr:indole-3-glycerol phosphate synthase TrpC [Deltaproteobacteria bacterium]